MHIQKLTVKIVTIQPVAIALPALSECLQVSELLPGHEITPYWSGVLLVPLEAIDEEGSFRWVLLPEISDTLVHFSLGLKSCLFFFLLSGRDATLPEPLLGGPI